MFLIAYALITLFTAIVSYAIGVFVLVKRFKGALNRVWFFLCLTIGNWNLGYYFTMLNINKNLALLSSRISHANGILIPVLFFHFILTFLNITSQKRRQLFFAYFSCLVLVLLSLTPFVVTDLLPKLTMRYYPVGKIGYLLYVITFIYLVVYAHYLILQAYRKSSGYKRNQIKYFLVGTILGFLGGANCFPLIFGIPLLPYASNLIFIYPFTTTYAILRYRLMDIRVAVTRAGIFAVVYTLVLGLPFVAIKFLKPVLMPLWGAYWWMSILILGMALASAGPFIYMYIQRRATEYLLREERRTHALLIKASMGLTNIRELK
ncbi:MAG: hypothetical protein NC828_04790, partial [Candidatus Omnitrophica bacterium]|nr:hypothetical protein [Candidatus Omnitrophota bacterium]